MPTFNIAPVNIQGVDVVMIILDSAFGSKSPREQQEIMMEFQKRAVAAGFRGEVIPVWSGVGGSIHFIAPTKLHSYLGRINTQYIAEHFNKQLSW